MNKTVFTIDVVDAEYDYILVIRDEQGVTLGTASFPSTDTVDEWQGQLNILVSQVYAVPVV